MVLKTPKKTVDFFLNNLLNLSFPKEKGKYKLKEYVK